MPGRKTSVFPFYTKERANTAMKRKSNEEKVFDEILATLVKARRQKLNLSQEVVSNNSGVTRITIGKWERGVKTPITFTTFSECSIQIRRNFGLIFQMFTKKESLQSVKPPKRKNI